MKRIEEAHKQEYSQKALVRLSIPSLLVLSGQFAPYCRGYMLCGIEEPSISITISKSPDSFMWLFSLQTSERKRFAATNVKYRKEDRWANIVKGVIYEFEKHDIKTPALQITIGGPGVKAESMNYSSSIALGFTIAVIKLLNIKVEESVITKVAYYAQKFAKYDACRLMDLIAIMKCKKNNLMLFDNHSLQYDYIELEQKKCYLIQSGLPVNSLNDEIKKVHKESKELYNQLKDEYGVLSLRDYSISEILDFIGNEKEDKKRYILSSITQSKISKEIAIAIKDKDFHKAGRLLNEEELLLRDGFEVTCPEIDWLTKRVTEDTLSYGATLVYSQNTGTVLVISDSDFPERFMPKIDEYNHIFGFKAQIIEFIPKNGVDIDENSFNK